MSKNTTGKLTLSSKYGAAVQLYHKANGDITFYACYLDYSKLDKNGKPLRQRIKIGNQSEGITQGYVKAKRDELATKARLGEVPDSIKIKRRKEAISVQYLAGLYFEELSSRSNSPENVRNVKKYQSVFKNHLEVFSFRTAGEIEDAEVEALKHDLLHKKGLSAATINNALVLLQSILNLGINRNLIFSKPKVNKIKGVENRRERFFDESEIRQILEHVKSNKVLDLFVRLSLSTGGRLETIRIIQVKDINLNTNSIALTVKGNDFSRGMGKEISRPYFINFSISPS